jgi:hypothetical protein
MSMYCSACKQELDDARFYKRQLTPNRKTLWCIKCSRLKAADYVQRNLTKVLAKNKEWYLKNKSVQFGHCRAYQARRRKKVIDAYGGKCACCGESQIEFLAVDHKNNDGNKDRKKFKGNIYVRAIRMGFPDMFQILCHNCNMAKAFYGCCPHQKQTVSPNPR